jgi:hypothetical protein
MTEEQEVRASHEEVADFVAKLSDFRGSLGESEQAMLDTILDSAQGETGGYRRWRSGDEASWNDLVGWIEEQGEEETQGFLGVRRGRDSTRLARAAAPRVGIYPRPRGRPLGGRTNPRRRGAEAAGRFSPACGVSRRSPAQEQPVLCLHVAGIARARHRCAQVFGALQELLEVRASQGVELDRA